MYKDGSSNDSGRAFKKLEKQVASLETKLKEKEKELEEATDLLLTYKEQLKECEELKGRIDKEVEKRIDRLMFKQFDGCKRCKG